jgi:two-component system response regulator YesN
MIKLLLADDEPVIVRGLKKLIDWNQLGIEVIGEAFGGKQAERMIFDFKPSIVISDICMPELSGIEILKMIRENGLNTKVIFLSGYRDFNYARDAVTLGAIDYLLKPIDKDHLEGAVRKAIAALDRELEDIRLRSKLSTLETEARDAAADKYLDRLELDRVVPEDIRRIFASYGMDGENGYFTFLSIGINDLIQKNDVLSEQEMRLIRFSVFNQIAHWIGRDRGIVFHMGDRICAVLRDDGPDTGAEHSKTVAEGIRRHINSSLHIGITVGIGDTVQGVRQIQKSHAGSMKMLDEKALSKGVASGASDIRKVKDYIEKHYMENITLDTVAGIACMNAYYFSSFFKKHTGENFKDFLTRLRMEKALQLLLNTDMKTYEIAEQVGFNDARHFSGMFRKYYGKNPLEYKNSLHL